MHVDLTTIYIDDYRVIIASNTIVDALLAYWYTRADHGNHLVIHTLYRRGGPPPWCGQANF